MAVLPDRNMIKLENVYLSFGKKHVLKNVSLHVPEGQISALIGLSGVGKSTILKLIIGFLKPDKGKIYVEGKDITVMSEHQLDGVRSKMGMAFQYSALFDYMSCGENVAFGLRQHSKLKDKEIKKIVTEKLNLVGLEGVENLFPSEISGGMRKRVGFARAIAYNPKILLYDEPTSGLDPVMTSVLNSLILKLNKELNITSLVITHDIGSVFHFADRVAMVYEGEIVEESSSEEFKNTKNPVVQQFIKGEEEGPIKVLHL